MKAGISLEGSYYWTEAPLGARYEMLWVRWEDDLLGLVKCNGLIKNVLFCFTFYVILLSGI